MMACKVIRDSSCLFDYHEAAISRRIYILTMQRYLLLIHANLWEVLDFYSSAMILAFLVAGNVEDSLRYLAARQVAMKASPRATKSCHGFVQALC